MGMRKAASSAVGRLAAGWVRAVARTATLRVVGAEGALGSGTSCAPLAAQLVRDTEQGHAIVPLWSAHQLAMAVLANERFGLRPALDRFDVVADDSFGGNMMHALGASMQLKMRSLHAQGDPRRLEDLGAWLRQPGPFFLAVDGGTTYGTVPTGTIRLAARLRSRLWPIAVRARPSFRIPGLVAEIPLPGATVVLAIGAPMVVERGTPVAAAASELAHRLNTATHAATNALSDSNRPLALEGAGPAPDLWRRTG